MRILFVSLLITAITFNLKAQTDTPTTVDSFFNQPFGFEESILKLTMFSGIKFKIEKEAVANLHNPAIIDTIYHLKKGKKNNISIYKAQDKMFVYHAKLRHRKVNLASGISPKMKRGDFYSKLRDLDDTGQNFHIFYNSDSTAIAQATFRDDRLRQIEIEYMVD